MKRILSLSTGILLSILLICPSLVAQTTAFTYQGSLNTGGTPANGNHDFEFALFDSLSGGSQHGSTLTRANVAVTNGVFSVSLNFGNLFPDSERFLEIRVRPSGGAFTTLAPRQSISSAPYSITSFNANRLGGVPAANFLTSNMTTISALTQFNIGVDRVLSIGGTANTVVGVGAGSSNSGQDNSFFGENAGNANTIGTRNSFFGSRAGAFNTTGTNNSFFGTNAGDSNTSGERNTFFGSNAGRSTTTGPRNSFFGSQAGQLNTTGDDNAFFGQGAGFLNTAGRQNAFFGTFAGGDNTGDNNSFVGTAAGGTNTTGARNSFLGSGAGNNTTTGSNNSAVGRHAGLGNAVGSDNSYFGANSGSTDALTNATAIGAEAFVSTSNSLVLGSINGVNGSTANTRVGIGTTAPINRLTIGQPETPGLNGSVGVFNGGGAFVVARDTTNDIEGFFGADENGVLFGSITDSIVRIRTGNTNRLIIDVGGNAIFTGIVNMNSFTVTNTLDTGGSVPICRNAVNRLSTCSSSLRYKSNINDFTSGLDLIKRLRPVSFSWKDDGMVDFGLVAEEVAKVGPLLTTTNEKGQVEGVKYDRVGVVLVNAVKEQQAQIEAQTELIKRQQEQIDALTKLVCKTNAAAEFCKENR